MSVFIWAPAIWIALALIVAFVVAGGIRRADAEANTAEARLEAQAQAQAQPESVNAR